MPVDPSVLKALAAAVAADPANPALRLHYGELLLEDQQHAQALEQLGRVLALTPDNVQAMEKAALAAEGAGDKIRAAGYRKLVEALSWNRTKTLIDSAGDESFRDTEDEREPVKLEASSQEPAGEEAWDSELPEITLENVAGMREVKRRLNSAFLAPMRNPDMRKLYGKSLKGGLMLYGPPGCGKTYIARALAGELGARFLAVGITDVFDMYLGESERRLHEIFQAARRWAPCVVFLDEIDAVGQKRSQMRHSAGRSVANQLLAEMDGTLDSNEGIFILGATNHPWDVDTALQRPGRFDRSVLVLPPDEETREQILRMNLEHRPCNDLNLRWVAERTDEFSGADLYHLCETATELAMEDSIESGQARPITMGDLKRALKEVRPSTRTWFENAKNYALYANQGGLYDDLLEYVRARKMV